MWLPSRGHSPQMMTAQAFSTLEDRTHRQSELVTRLRTTHPLRQDEDSPDRGSPWMMTSSVIAMAHYLATYIVM